MLELKGERGKHIWIVCAEAKNHVTIWSYHDGISSHRNFRERSIIGVESRFFIRTDNGLESMSVQVERVFAGVIVVEDYLDDLVLFENVSVNIGSVDGSIGGRGTSGKSSVESWDFGLYVGNIVEECTWLRSQIFSYESQEDILICTIAEVIHFHVQVERHVWIFEKLFAVLRHQGKVIKRIKFINRGWFWQRFCFIVY